MPPGSLPSVLRIGRAVSGRRRHCLRVVAAATGWRGVVPCQLEWADARRWRWRCSWRRGCLAYKAVAVRAGCCGLAGQKL